MMEKSVQVLKCASHEDWLKKRVIGGSDVAVILGISPFKTKDKLYRELIGKDKPEDISDKECVKFGHQAEEPLRKIFELLFAEDYEVIPPATIEKDGYIELYQRVDKPFMTATPDGRLIDRHSKEEGIWEGKTVHVITKAKREEWDGKIPDYYYPQPTYYEAVLLKPKFFVLSALFLFENSEGEKWQTIKHYLYRPSQEEIDFVEEEVTKFWSDVENRIEPPFILKL